MTSRLYVGVPKEGHRREVIRTSEPTQSVWGGIFFALIGPFNTRAGASLLRDNPLISCVQDAERIANRR